MVESQLKDVPDAGQRDLDEDEPFVGGQRAGGDHGAVPRKAPQPPRPTAGTGVGAEGIEDRTREGPTREERPGIPRREPDRTLRTSGQCRERPRVVVVISVRSGTRFGTGGNGHRRRRNQDRNHGQRPGRDRSVQADRRARRRHHVDRCGNRNCVDGSRCGNGARCRKIAFEQDRRQRRQCDPCARVLGSNQVEDRRQRRGSHATRRGIDRGRFGNGDRNRGGPTRGTRPGFHSLAHWKGLRRLLGGQDRGDGDDAPGLEDATEDDERLGCGPGLRPAREGAGPPLPARLEMPQARSGGRLGSRLGTEAGAQSGQPWER